MPTTAPWPSMARSNSPSTGIHFPSTTDQVRLGAPTISIPLAHAQQRLGGRRNMGTLDLNRLRLPQTRRALKPVALWTR